MATALTPEEGDAIYEALFGVPKPAVLSANQNRPDEPHYPDVVSAVEADILYDSLFPNDH